MGTKRFSVSASGDVVTGVAPGHGFVNVTNITAATGMRAGQHLLARNVMVGVGPFDVDVPFPRYGDYVRVTHHAPEGRTSQIVRLKAGLDPKKQRAPYTVRQAFEVVRAAEPGQVTLQSQVRSRQFGFPNNQVWFQNMASEQITSADLDERGHLPANFHMPGEPTDGFKVVISTEPLESPPDFTYARQIGGRATTEAFDDDSMVEHTGPLYGERISADDPIQGRVGNCWFVADFGAVADVRPDLIEKMIEPLDKGRFRVTFKKYDAEKEAYVDDPVIVTSKLHRDSWGLVYGRSSGSTKADKMKLWFPIVDKAYAQLRGSHAATRTGGCGDTFERILGAPPQWLGTRETEPRMLFDAIAEAIEGGQPVSAATRLSFGHWVTGMFSVASGRGLVADHAYTVRGAFERNGKKYITLRNTWGKHVPVGYGTRRAGEFDLPLDLFMKTFNGAAIAQLPEDS